MARKSAWDHRVVEKFISISKRKSFCGHLAGPIKMCNPSTALVFPIFSSRVAVAAHALLMPLTIATAFGHVARHSRIVCNCNLPLPTEKTL